MDIELEETPSFGRYFIPSDEATDDVAELTFTNRDRHTMVADHTYVPVRYRGQGLIVVLSRIPGDAVGGAVDQRQARQLFHVEPCARI